MAQKIDISFDIDDNYVISRAIDEATKELVKALRTKVFEKRYSWSSSEQLTETTKDIIKSWLTDNKEDLYKHIAHDVAASLMRSNKFREMVAIEMTNEEKRMMNNEENS